MPLSLNQIKEILQQPRNQRTIRTAVAHENRIRLHTETTLDAGTNSAVTEFLNWVDKLIPEYKAYLFKTLFRFPVATVSLSEEVFAALEKLFDGRDIHRAINFSTPEVGQNFAGYLEQINFYTKWRRESFSAFKTAPNSVIICDLPKEQEGELPNPYFYFLPIGKVVSFEGNLDWILFHSGKDQMMWIDNEAYYTIRLEDGEPIAIDGIAPHDLGYTPARFFMDEGLNADYQYVKRSPLSPELSNLDWFLFHAISKRHLDMYGAYPIYWGYAPDCDYEDPVKEIRCDGGFLKKYDGSHLLDRVGGSLMRCPACADTRLNGAGSYNEIPAPEDRDSPNITPPVGIVSIDRQSLTYNVDEQRRLKLEIYTNVTGYGGDLKTDQAVNEKQVMASFDTRASVLKNWKREFETSETWVVGTLAALRHGGAYLSNYSDYGSEFYIYSPQELLTMYDAGLQKQWSDQILTMLQDQYYETKHRNNPKQLSRIRTLTALEPYRHLTRVEVRELFAAGLVTDYEYYIKVNFASLIDRFERENGDIVEFGRRVNFETKINSITNALISYAQEKITEAQRRSAGATE